MNVVWPRLLNPKQLIQIIRRQKNPFRALQIFNEAKSRFPNYHHNGPAYATILDILASSGRISEMREIIDQMREDSCEHKDYVFASAIKTYARAGLLDEAVSLFKALPQFNCVDWTESFNTLLQVMANECKFESVCSLFLEYSHGWEVKTRIHALNLLIGVLCQHKRSDLALHIFQEMNYQCCSPDRETYRVLMRGLCEDGRLNEATHLLYSMFWRVSQKGSGEDVVVYRSFLDALCDHSQVDQAVEILNKVLRKGLKASKRHGKLDVVHSFNGVDIQRVKVSIHEALVKGLIPSSVSYSAMAIDLYSEDKIDEADMVIYEMNAKGFRTSVEVYEAKLAALCRQGKVDEAINIVQREMVDGNCVPTVRVYNTLIRGLCEEGKSILAIQYVEEMGTRMGPQPDKDLYIILVDGLCRDGRFMEASKVLEGMLMRSYWPSIGMYGLVIRGLCSLDRPYEALLWLEEMVSQGMEPERSIWDALTTTMCANVTTTNLVSVILKQLR